MLYNKKLTGTMPLVKSVGYVYRLLPCVLSRMFCRLVGTPRGLAATAPSRAAMQAVAVFITKAKLAKLLFFEILISVFC